MTEIQMPDGDTIKEAYDADETYITRTIPNATLTFTSVQSSPKLYEQLLGGEEVRTTDPDTGAQKGTKLARHSLIPVEALTEIAEHYGKGASKYDAHNWRKGYDWSKSYDALCRHLSQFWGGEDFDEETGSKHIIAVAWHAIALSVFMDEHPEKDDRWTTVK